MLRAFCILILMGLATAAHAQGDVDIYTVSGVKIDASGENATAARQTAIAEGAAEALHKLFKRLTMERDHDSLPTVSPSTATSLASGFQIDNELRAATRYRGLLTVSFDPVGVSNFLRNRGIAFVETAAPPTLILPVLDAGGRARLWEANPWADVWSEDRYEATFTPVILPDGFQTDQQILSVSKALQPDVKAIRALARMYKVERVLLAVARPESGNVRVDLTFIRTEPEFEEMDDEPDNGAMFESSFEDSLSADLDEDAESDDGEDGFGDNFQPIVTPLDPVRAARDEGDNILQIAADRAQGRLGEEWKKVAVVRAKQRTEIQLTVLYRDISEWLDLRRAIGASPFVADARLDGVSRDGALMTVTYRGLHEQLAGDLRRRGARLQTTPQLGEVVYSDDWRPSLGREMGGDDMNRSRDGGLQEQEPMGAEDNRFRGGL